VRCAELIISLFLSCWLAASIAAQLPVRVARQIRRYDLFGLVPSWSFFAPRPASHDNHLLFREFQTDGMASDWTEVHIGERHTALGLIWNPGRREQKALSDAVNSLLRSARRGNFDSLQLTVPYLLLLNYIDRLPRSNQIVGIQFSLFRTEGPLTPNPILSFISNVHRATEEDSLCGGAEP
jgi:hypothetical protein